MGSHGSHTHRNADGAKPWWVSLPAAWPSLGLRKEEDRPWRLGRAISCVQRGSRWLRGCWSLGVFHVPPSCLTVLQGSGLQLGSPPQGHREGWLSAANP